MNDLIPAATKFPARIARVTLAAAALLTAIGCASGRTESYSISLHNAGDAPVTVWLTKTGDRQQQDWLAPEDLSTSRAASVEAINGVVVPPGKTATVGPISGKFEYEALAILRIYAGRLTFDQLLATPVDGKLRVDFPLREGDNRLTVRGPMLNVTRDGGAPAQVP